jgi:hypothetical protein
MFKRLSARWPWRSTAVKTVLRERDVNMSILDDLAPMTANNARRRVYPRLPNIGINDGNSAGHILGSAR